MPDKEFVLKPCPFCGDNEAPLVVVRRGKDGWRDRFLVLCDCEHGGCGGSSGWYHYEPEAVGAWNRRATAADVEPVRHGWWIPGDHFEYDGHGETVRHPGGITCSQCRYNFAEKYLWSRSYCPHCGAKMDAEPPKEADDAKA